jgi:hypothetical protein
MYMAADEGNGPTCVENTAIYSHPSAATSLVANPRFVANFRSFGGK